MNLYRTCLLVASLFFAVVVPNSVLANATESQSDESSSKVHAVKFFFLLAPDRERRAQAIAEIEASWSDDYVAPIVEILTLTRDFQLHRDLTQLLERHTKQDFGSDLQAWFKWVWSKDVGTIDGYPEFKAWLYGQIDSKFDGYFATDREATIRLDEVRWGGVAQDGIPPLRSPKMIAAGEADYLADSDVVFALEVNGDARAYPKRILAWHEMFVDSIGGIDFAGVYCTLCGSMILYETQVDGVHHEMGTSGFLYRSNKLMYDQATQSLWSTLLGKPVIGPLVGEGIEFDWRSVVTTTWGEWRKRHPDTTVLALETGYDRDYGEGVAYQAYFATDELMFDVPQTDSRLKNKAEILGLRLKDFPGDVLAISAEYLKAKPLVSEEIGSKKVVILTDSTGANRVYEQGSVAFDSWDQEQTLVDGSGQDWLLTEDVLVGPNGQSLKRIPAYRAFWFGWYSQHPETRLVF